jgi:tetratricopeptide (TPR) repeat protein
VPYALLQAIAELSEEELRRGLGHLQAAEFLYETSLFPELEYTFKHALTHEVAYGSLLQERRSVLHARIVEASERLYADRLPEQAERLAEHAFRGEVWDKAVAYCRQAGTKAYARSALREVVASFEQTLEALKHLPESRAMQEQAIDLRFDLRTALWQSGEIRQTLDYLREAATLAKALDDQPRLGRVSAYMCRYLREMGDHDGAVESGLHALAVAGTLGDFALQVMARHYLGVAYHTLGDYRRAMGLLRSNVESLTGELLRERFGLPGLPAVRSRDWLARCLAELGAFPEGIAHAEEAVRIAEAVDHPNNLVHAYLGVGLLSLRQGALSRAIPALERCLDLCRVFDIRLWFPETAAALGCAYACAGRVAEALPLLEQAEQRDAAMETMGGHALRVGYVSEVYLLAGRMQEAVQLAGRALDLAHAHKERGYQAWALRLLGEIAAHQAPPEVEPAAHHYRQALALAEELGMRPLQAHCHLGLGTLYAKTGQREQARAELSTAIEMYRAMGMTFWLPQAEVVLAQVEER